MATFDDRSLSVILPVYNEAGLVDGAVRRAVASLERQVADFEILLIDDASTDATPGAVDALAHELAPVRAIHNERNLKQGGSLRVGFGLAEKELVMHNAIDEPFAFDDLGRLLEYFPEADVVVVTRRTYPGVTAGRRFVSRVHRTLLRVLFGLPIEDFNFVQIYKRDALMQDESFLHRHRLHHRRARGPRPPRRAAGGGGRRRLSPAAGGDVVLGTAPGGARRPARHVPPVARAAIRGHTAARRRAVSEDLFGDQIPFLKPWVGEEEAAAVREVILSGWFSMGPKTAEFEVAVGRAHRRPPRCRHQRRDHRPPPGAPGRRGGAG